jgi:hypothetical protein
LSYLTGDGDALLVVGVPLDLLGSAPPLHLAPLVGVGVAGLLLHRVGEVVSQFVAEPARLHLALLHAHLNLCNSYRIKHKVKYGVNI